MNKSQLFLFSIISTSIFFSSSAMNPESETNSNALMVIEKKNDLMSRARRIDGQQIMEKVLLGTAWGTAYTVHIVGYGIHMVKEIYNSPTTATVINNTKAGIASLMDKAKEAGITVVDLGHDCYKGTVNNQDIYFTKPLWDYNNSMASLLKDTSDTSKANALNSLTTLKKQLVSLIGKDNGVRINFMDHAMARLQSTKNPISTEDEVLDLTHLMNEIFLFSTTKNAQGQLDNSVIEIDEPQDDHQALFASQISEEESKYSIKNVVFFDFMQKYMPDEFNDIVQKAPKQNPTTTAEMKQFQLGIKIKQLKATLQIFGLVTGIEELEAALQEIETFKKQEIEVTELQIQQLNTILEEALQTAIQQSEQELEEILEITAQQINKAKQESKTKKQEIKKLITQVQEKETAIEALNESMKKQNSVANTEALAKATALEQDLTKATALEQDLTKATALEQDLTKATALEQDLTKATALEQDLTKAERSATLWRRLTMGGATIIGLLAMLYKLNMLDKIGEQLHEKFADLLNAMPSFKN